MCLSDNIDRMTIPPVKALEILEQAETVFLRPCPCRVLARLCPPDTWEVCLLFNGAPEEDLKDAKPISKEKALSILKATHERNVIYNLFFRHPDHVLTEICSCCTCCCRAIRNPEVMGHYSALLQSEYMAVTDKEHCIGCGACVENCFFKARKLIDDSLHLAEKDCYGCGRCLSACPQGAITLKPQSGHGIPIPALVFA